MSQTTIASEVLALLWALKIDTTGLAEMPLIEARDAVRERVERVLDQATSPELPPAGRLEVRVAAASGEGGLASPG
jgi:hypothetical protein